MKALLKTLFTHNLAAKLASLALAIRFDHLIRSGQVASYAEVARLGHVTRARVCQVMNLLQLAPDIQEAVLFLPHTERGRDPIHLRQLQPLAAALDWNEQRWRWKSLVEQVADEANEGLSATS